MTDRLLTARQLADRLVVSTETVLRWSRQGKLPAIPLPGGAIRFREDEIEHCLEQWAAQPRGALSATSEVPRPQLRSPTQPAIDDEEG